MYAYASRERRCAWATARGHLGSLLIGRAAVTSIAALHMQAVHLRGVQGGMRLFVIQAGPRGSEEGVLDNFSIHRPSIAGGMRAAHDHPLFSKNPSNSTLTPFHCRRLTARTGAVVRHGCHTSSRYPSRHRSRPIMFVPVNLVSWGPWTCLERRPWLCNCDSGTSLRPSLFLTRAAIAGQRAEPLLPGDYPNSGRAADDMTMWSIRQTCPCPNMSSQ